MDYAIYLPTCQPLGLFLDSDSKTCIEAVKYEAKKSPWRLINFVESVRHVTESSVGISFNWGHREANNSAHVFAKWSLSNSVYGSFDLGFSPSFVDLILEEAAQAFL